jgi:hypothetical protein
MALRESTWVAAFKLFGARLGQPNNRCIRLPYRNRPLNPLAPTLSFRLSKSMLSSAFQ